jgi:hypothetical protein
MEPPEMVQGVMDPPAFTMNAVVPDIAMPAGEEKVPATGPV